MSETSSTSRDGNDVNDVTGAKEADDVKGANAVNGGNATNAVNTFTPEQARMLAGGAKTGAPPAKPWDEFDPEAPPKFPFTLRFNNYDKAIAHYVAGLHQSSLQKTIIKLLREAARRDIAEREKPKKRAAGHR